MTQDDLIICAFRYCMGRQTYVVSDMCRYLSENWEGIGTNAQNLIKKEIGCAVDRDMCGSMMDQNSWLWCLEVVEEKDRSRWIKDRLMGEDTKDSK